MKDLKPLFIRLDTLEGPVKLTVPVKVDDQGRFFMVIPDEIQDNVTAIIRERGDKYAQIDGHPSAIHSNRGDRKLQASGTDLKSLTWIVQEAFKQFYTPESKKETVILYNIESHASFAIGKDGGLYPNPGVAKEVGAIANWPDESKGERYGGHSATDPADGGYSLVFCARVFTKVTMKRGKVTKVKYDHWEDEDDGAYGDPSWGKMLNGFVSYNFPGDLKNRRAQDEMDVDWAKDSTVKELPYTEEAAKFLYENKLAFCRLIYALDAFLNVDAATIQKHIASKAGIRMLSDTMLGLPARKGGSNV